LPSGHDGAVESGPEILKQASMKVQNYHKGYIFLIVYPAREYK
jgi:hypothetical protein